MNIDPDIPLPVDRFRSDESRLAARLEVGHSILCETVRQYENVRATIRRLGGRYQARKIDGGWRVWRIA